MAFVRLLAALGAAAAFTVATVASAAEHEVEIRDNRFIPASVTVRIGDTVRWVNREKRTSHSVLFKSPVALESPRFFPEESWSYRFDAAGEYVYGCGPHPEMAGTVKVGE